jgi:hypothetical protein
MSVVSDSTAYQQTGKRDPTLETKPKTEQQFHNSGSHVHELHTTSVKLQQQLVQK